MLYVHVQCLNSCALAADITHAVVSECIYSKASNLHSSPADIYTQHMPQLYSVCFGLPNRACLSTLHHTCVCSVPLMTRRHMQNDCAFLPADEWVLYNIFCCAVLWKPVILLPQVPKSPKAKHTCHNHLDVHEICFLCYLGVFI